VATKPGKARAGLAVFLSLVATAGFAKGPQGNKAAEDGGPTGDQGASLYMRVKAYNPDLPREFVRKGNKRMQIVLPDGTSINLYQTKQFAHANYRHTLANISGISTAKQDKLRTTFAGFKKAMCTPRFDENFGKKGSKKINKMKRAFRYGHKGIRIRFKPGEAGETGHAIGGNQIEMSFRTANKMGSTWATAILAHEMNHLFGMSHGDLMWRFDHFFKNYRKWSSYKVYDLEELFPGHRADDPPASLGQL
jgi:hypothetical protein